LFKINLEQQSKENDIINEQKIESPKSHHHISNRIPSFQRILVAYDGTEISNRALEYASYISKIANSEIVIINVIEDNSEVNNALPHHPLTDSESGEVIIRAYQKLLDAQDDDDLDKWDLIPLGSTIITDPRKLINPVSGIDFDLEALDSHATYLPPAPRIGPKEHATIHDDNGAEAAGEMEELYWMALSRDVHFGDFISESVINNAVDDLSTNYTRFPIPKNSTLFPVSKKNLFRGFAIGDIKGPYISQFLLKGMLFFLSIVRSKEFINILFGVCIIW
jgi:hypothetical protein